MHLEDQIAKQYTIRLENKFSWSQTGYVGFDALFFLAWNMLHVFLDNTMDSEWPTTSFDDEVLILGSVQPRLQPWTGEGFLIEGKT